MQGTSEKPAKEVTPNASPWPSKPKKGGNLRHKFTKTEDETLKRMVETYGEGNWAAVASGLKNRTARQCRERFKNYLSPNIKNLPWTHEEEVLLEEKVKEFGQKWAKIALFFEQRSDVNVKNHWTAMQNRQQRERSLQAEKNEIPMENGMMNLCQMPEGSYGYMFGKPFMPPIMMSVPHYPHPLYRSPYHQLMMQMPMQMPQLIQYQRPRYIQPVMPKIIQPPKIRDGTPTPPVMPITEPVQQSDMFNETVEYQAVEPPEPPEPKLVSEQTDEYQIREPPEPPEPNHYQEREPPEPPEPPYLTLHDTSNHVGSNSVINSQKLDLENDFSDNSDNHTTILDRPSFDSSLFNYDNTFDEPFEGDLFMD